MGLDVLRSGNDHERFAGAKMRRLYAANEALERDPQGAKPLRGDDSEDPACVVARSDNARAEDRGEEDAGGALDEREHSRLHSASSCSVLERVGAGRRSR